MSKDQAELTLPDNLFLSDNFFKVRWHGLGNRRLKTCIVILQWIHPGQVAPVFASITLAEAETVRWMMQNSPTFDGFCVSLHSVSGEMLAQTSAHAAAALALQHRPASGGQQAAFQVWWQINITGRMQRFSSLPCCSIYFAFCAICNCGQVQPSLVRIQDAKSAAIWFVFVAFRIRFCSCSGRFRFFNCELFFSDEDLEKLESILRHVAARNKCDLQK